MRTMSALRRVVILAALILGAASMPLRADVLPANPSGALTQYQLDLMKSATLGPARVPLRDQAVLSLPPQLVFVHQEPAKTFMQRMGNATDANFLGLILPWQASDWFITVEFIPSGHVNDDDAKNWQPDELLQSIREGTDKANVERRKEGVPELDILGWLEKPRYDDAKHRLVWSISARQKGGTADGSNLVNYRMLALGREGYIGLVMVTGANVIADRKPIANLVLSDINFNSGKRYTDFNASTDRVAAYGLAALIGGVVVHKLGLFALIAAFLVKGVKFIGLAVVAAFAAVRRFFGGKKTATAPAIPPPGDPPA